MTSSMTHVDRISMDALKRLAFGQLARRYSAPSVAYVYHPNLNTLEADKQSFEWTKTIQLNLVPQSIQNGVETVDTTEWRERMSSAILQSKGFESPETDRTNPDYVYGLIQNLFRCLFAAHPERMKSTHVTWDPSLAASWLRNGKKYAVRGKTSLIMSAKQPLPAHFSKETVEESSNREIPSVWPIDTTIDLSPQASLKERFSTSAHAKTSFPHLHTMLVLYQQPLTDAHIIQKGLCLPFARLLAEANLSVRSQPGVLHTPLPGQCIATNGKKFTFFYYQLNTLDLEEDAGIKNQVHVDGPHLLYRKLAKKGGKKFVVDLNEHALRLLIATLTNQQQPLGSVATDNGN